LLARAQGWLLVGLLLVAWQVGAAHGFIASRLLPAPSLVVAAGWRLALSGELGHHALISTRRALLGLLIGGGAGLVLGLVNGLLRPAERLLDTPLQMLRNIPHLALIPLVIVWFGLGEEAKVFLVAIGSIFPLYVNTYHGVRSVDPGLTEMGRNYGLGRAAMLRHIVIPSALPSILVGLRYALGVMWLSLIVAETVATDAGLGYLAMNAREFMQTDVMLLSILLYAFLGKAADSFTRVLERLTIRGVGRSP